MTRTRNFSTKNDFVDNHFPLLDSTIAGGKKSCKNGTTPEKPPKAASEPTTSANTGTTSKDPIAPPKGSLIPAAQALSHKLDDSFDDANQHNAIVLTNSQVPSTSKDNTTTTHLPPNKNKLSFSADTSFTNLTVGKEVRCTMPPKKQPGLPTPPQPTLYSKVAASTTPLSTKKLSTTTTKQSKTTKQTTSPHIDPAPGEKSADPVPQLYSFVARVTLSVPNCNSMWLKVMNMLAFRMNILKKKDPTATYQNLHDPNKQASTIQELPCLEDFLDDWSCFKHIKSDFRNFTLDAGRTKKFRGSQLIGCSMEPKKLLADTFLELDNGLDESIGGGKITFEYKPLQVVETERNWILFGIPGTDIHPESFGNMVRPFLQHAMWKMSDKNPTKYPASKYSGSLPDFVINISYAQNVPFKMAEKLPPQAKLLIHFEMRQSDSELFQEIFRFISLSKLDKRMFGQFARFHKGPPPGASQIDREGLGHMLQNHVTVVRSMGKVPLPGIMHPDKIMPCLMTDNTDGEPRESVHISLRRIMMKQRIGKPKIWQCILPNANGGWDGHYANGFGCGKHRQKALAWAVCSSAHLRFHLLKKGVLPESITDFINQVFTCKSASEAFSAKLIRGEVYTYGAASAANMCTDLENSGWIDISLGMSETSQETHTYRRPQIALKVNRDLASHNFSTDRNPDITDTGSVAYSARGDTTLGGDIEIIDKQDNEEVTISKEEDVQSYITMDGSTESQLWNGKKRPTDTSFNVENMEVEIAIPTFTRPRSRETENDMESCIADLQRQIEILRSTNKTLLATAAAKPGITYNESHIPSNVSEKADDSGKGGGGMH